MSKKKAMGTIKNGRNSESKRLGVKVFGGAVNSGQILVRQRGTKYHPGKNVKRTSDDTLISTTQGSLTFKRRKVSTFTGNLKERIFLNVE